MDTIRIRGARTHNLKGIDADIPRERLVVVTGLSGSGKSSLAFDTLFAEGQRRYVESLSSYARQFLSVMDKPEVELIDGLSPAIAIEQKSTSHNPRSTVGTITEVHDYLRVLFARAGIPHCPRHGEPLEAQTIGEMVDRALALPAGRALALLAPLARARKGEQTAVLDRLRAEGYLRARVDGRIVELDEEIRLDKRRKHDIDVVVDRFKVREGIEQRLAESFETATALGEGTAIVAPLAGEGRDEDIVLSTRHACPLCGYAVPALEPRLFSFNSPEGACPDCDGLGVSGFVDPALVLTDPAASVADGAIRGWERGNVWYFGMLRSLAEHYGFDVETPFEALPERVREVLLYGSGEEEIVFRHERVDGRGRHETTRAFEGVIPNIERRYRETESGAVREELARLFANRPCESCGGARLNEAARQVRVDGHTLPEIAALAIGRAKALIESLEPAGRRAAIAAPVIAEIRQRLGFLVDVGLDYLALARGAGTLSGGEAQRIRLASQIGAGLQGVLYVLDEPSIGLHPRDNARLIGTLARLRDLGNTVVVVEHDADTIRAADHVVDLGPGAGVHGGEIVASGSPADIVASAASLTGQYLSGERRVPRLARRAPKAGASIRIRGASGNNLRGIDVEIPLGLLVCVSGVSGSGKSTLVNETLLAHTANRLHRARRPAAAVDAIEGLEALDKVVAVDQSPIGRTPRSNPATYSGVFGPIRELFAATPEARSRGYAPGRFSFNVRGGRCEACQGDGLIRVEMHFLPDVYVPCDICRGRRYGRETLEVRYKGESIADVLDMTVERALDFFRAVPAIARKLETLDRVGLAYLTLGQSATTLSGGEAQRVKLARELSRRDTGATLYVLDEPTTGLHFEDIGALLGVLEALRDAGNTIVVIEHDLDVIAAADRVIDLGPEGGDGGGRVVATGTPEEIVRVDASYTGRHLRAALAGR